MKSFCDRAPPTNRRKTTSFSALDDPLDQLQERVIDPSCAYHVQLTTNLEVVFGEVTQLVGGRLVHGAEAGQNQQPLAVVLLVALQVLHVLPVTK